jgi:hypothetical protein
MRSHTHATPQPPQNIFTHCQRAQFKYDGQRPHNDVTRWREHSVFQATVRCARTSICTAVEFERCFDADSVCVIGCYADRPHLKKVTVQRSGQKQLGVTVSAAACTHVHAALQAHVTHQVAGRYDIAAICTRVAADSPSLGLCVDEWFCREVPNDIRVQLQGSSQPLGVGSCAVTPPPSPSSGQLQYQMRKLIPW